MQKTEGLNNDININNIYEQISSVIDVKNEEAKKEIFEKIKYIMEKNFIDNLTGLPNISELEIYLKNLENPITFIGVKMFFLNNLNHINPKYGNNHILEISKILRNIDGVEKIFKISGSKFGIVLSKNGNINNFIKTIKETKINIHNSEGKINKQTIPVKLAIVPEQKKSILSKMETTFSGEKNIGYYTESTSKREKDIEELDYYLKLDDSIENNRIVPFFQPMYNIEEGKISKYECLFRVKKENNIDYDFNYYKYLITADNLKIENITYKMIEKVFPVIKDNPGIDFSLNLGLNDLQNDELLIFILNKVKEYNINTSKVTFEILESAWEEKHIENNIDFIRILKSYGFKIAMDDFGVGNGSINILNRLISEILVDFVKIDGTLVKKAWFQEGAKADIKNLVNKLQNHGIKIIAEYIENKDISDMCKNLGINYLQGYHIGKPDSNLIIN